VLNILIHSFIPALNIFNQIILHEFLQSIEFFALFGVHFGLGVGAFFARVPEFGGAILWGVRV
jgi:hypothetical protein